MTLDEVRQRADDRLIRDFGREFFNKNGPGGYNSAWTDVRIDLDPEDDRAFQAYITTPNPKDERRIREIILEAVAGRRVRFM